MLRRLTIFAAVIGLFAASAFAQGARARRVEQQPAAAVSAPHAAAAPAADPLALAAVPFGPGTYRPKAASSCTTERAPVLRSTAASSVVSRLHAMTVNSTTGLPGRR